MPDDNQIKTLIDQNRLFKSVIMNLIECNDFYEGVLVDISESNGIDFDDFIGYCVGMNKGCISVKVGRDEKERA